MNIDSAFPSQYLKAADIPKGQKVRCQIDHVQLEDVSGDGSEQKPVLYFMGKSRGLVLNKTNSGRIKLGYGAETDDWTGKDIFLFQDVTQFQGRNVECLRVEIPLKEAAPDEPPPF